MKRPTAFLLTIVMMAIQGFFAHAGNAPSLYCRGPFAIAAPSNGLMSFTSNIVYQQASGQKQIIDSFKSQNPLTSKVICRAVLSKLSGHQSVADYYSARIAPMFNRGCKSSADCPGAEMCDVINGICVNPDGSGATKCKTSADCPGSTLCNFASGTCYQP